MCRSRCRALRNVNPLDLLETIRDGVLVVEPDLTIRFANRSFCHMFVAAPSIQSGGSSMRSATESGTFPSSAPCSIPSFLDRKTIEAFEVEHFFPSIGQRIMVLNARKVYRPGNKIKQILLAIEDVTERTRLEREHAAADERIGMLLQELTHRVKNSLQFIASIVMTEARSIQAPRPKPRLRGSRIASQPSGSSIQS